MAAFSLGRMPTPAHKAEILMMLGLARHGKTAPPGIRGYISLSGVGVGVGMLMMAVVMATGSQFSRVVSSLALRLSRLIVREKIRIWACRSGGEKDLGGRERN